MSITTETDQERHDRIIEMQKEDFLSTMMPWGSSDLWTALEIMHDVDMDGSELADLVTEFMESTDSSLDQTDVCYIALDHVLQQARNKIDEVLDFDACNDANFYVYGNAMCSSIDHSEEDTEKLQAKINEADADEIEDLKDDKLVTYFLKEVSVDFPKEA